MPICREREKGASFQSEFHSLVFCILGLADRINTRRFASGNPVPVLHWVTQSSAL